MPLLKIILALVISHSISAYLHYYTVLRDKITREKLQITISVALILISLT